MTDSLWQWGWALIAQQGIKTGSTPFPGSSSGPRRPALRGPSEWACLLLTVDLGAGTWRASGRKGGTWKRYKVGGGVSSAGRLLAGPWTRGTRKSRWERKGQQGGGWRWVASLWLSSQLLGIKGYTWTSWRRELKKEGAHPDRGESRGARAWCGDTGPGRRGGATSYFSAGWHRNRLPARVPWNRCRSGWERGLQEKGVKDKLIH